jgi:hypothetical protein
VEVAHLSEGFIDMRNVKYKIFVLISVSLILGCVTPFELERNKHSVLEENNLDSRNLISTLCSYYSVPKSSTSEVLPDMYGGLCALDTQTGTLFFKGGSPYGTIKVDKKIMFDEYINFGQSKTVLRTSLCESIEFFCYQVEQMVFTTKTEKHIIQFHKKDSDNFTKVYRQLNLNEVKLDAFYYVNIPQVNYDWPIVNRPKVKQK